MCFYFPRGLLTKYAFVGKTARKLCVEQHHTYVVGVVQM